MEKILKALQSLADGIANNHKNILALKESQSYLAKEVIELVKEIEVLKSNKHK